MVVRVVLAVVVALALVGVSIPAFDHATRTADRQSTRAAAVAVQDAVGTLVDQNDPAPPGAPAAVRTLDLALPAGDGRIEVGGRSPAVLRWSAGGTSRVLSLPVPVVPEAASRVALAGDSVVRLWYVVCGGRGIVLLTRGFIRDDGTNGVHARPACPVRASDGGGVPVRPDGRVGLARAGRQRLPRRR